MEGVAGVGVEVGSGTDDVAAVGNKCAVLESKHVAAADPGVVVDC